MLFLDDEHEFYLPDPPPFPGAKSAVWGVTEEWPGERGCHVSLAAVASIFLLAAVIVGMALLLMSRGAL